MRDWVDTAKTVLMVVVVLGTMLGGLVALNKFANARNEARCVAVGGEFYKAPEASHSLCKMPR